MLPAVAQTLADFFASGMPAVTTESIRFEHPSFLSDVYPSLNLYLAGIGQNLRSARPAVNPVVRTAGSALATTWFDASFLLTIQEHTVLGRQRLVSQALTHGQRYLALPADLLAPTLQGYGAIPLRVGLAPSDLWRSLEIPRQPALQITVTVPAAVLPSPTLLRA